MHLQQGIKTRNKVVVETFLYEINKLVCISITPNCLYK